MSDFKLCENGHYYSKDLAQCPYCPKNETSDNASFSSFDDLEKTQIGGENNPFDQTQIFGSQSPFPKSDFSSDDFTGSGNMGGSDLTRTQIFSDENSGMMGGDPFASNMGMQSPTSAQKLGRKLVGWLVSFTIEENGLDFRIYEGRNIIGSDPACDIVVTGDPSVSGKHLTVLHRMGHFKFRDEFSTNGTFVNDVFEEEGNLKDGDMIRIGETIFKFRSIA